MASVSSVSSPGAGQELPGPLQGTNCIHRGSTLTTPPPPLGGPPRVPITSRIRTLQLCAHTRTGRNTAPLQGTLPEAGQAEGTSSHPIPNSFLVLRNLLLLETPPGFRDTAEALLLLTPAMSPETEAPWDESGQS